MEYSNGTAEAYRYHGGYADPAGVFGGGVGVAAPPPPPASSSASSSMAGHRRFHPYGDVHLNGVGHADFGGGYDAGVYDATPIHHQVRFHSFLL